MPDNVDNVEKKSDKEEKTLESGSSARGELAGGKWDRWREPARLRSASQWLFLILVIWSGLVFGRYVAYIAGSPGVGPIRRPPSVEAFLPISALMSFVYFVKTGVLSRVHPAGLVIFLIIIATAVAVRRGFCSWVCPIGTLSEFAHKAGRSLLGKNLRMPMAADYMLKTLKYILLGFFVMVIAVRMPATELGNFLNGDYNRVVDVKMYRFFEHITPLSMKVLLALFVLSMLYKYFWCRYLCPYGALIGLLSLASPLAVKRDKGKCVSCGACTRACPNMIDVDQETRVNGVECMACYNCVEACPAEGALSMQAPGGRKVSGLTYAIIIVGSFILLTQLASLLNYWQTDTPVETYKRLYPIVDMLDHPRR